MDAFAILAMHICKITADTWVFRADALDMTCAFPFRKQNLLEYANENLKRLCPECRQLRIEVRVKLDKNQGHANIESPWLQRGPQGEWLEQPAPAL